ncbi:MAG: hypothetical protein QGG74_05110 [Phycisphaerales bacterium]|jgi:hypothetical protein|nr:hypothetical protein [Phycisphaerales bacterium]
MILNTHTDAKTDTLSSTQKVLHAEQGISVRMLPEQWIEIEAALPGTGLETTGVRIRGRVLTIEAVPPAIAGRADASPGIERVTTRVVLRDRPRGPVTATREASGRVRVRVPLKSTSVRDQGVWTADGIGGIAADVVTHAHISGANQTNSSKQETDVFPRRSGGVSVS